MTWTDADYDRFFNTVETCLAEGFRPGGSRGKGRPRANEGRTAIAEAADRLGLHHGHIYHRLQCYRGTRQIDYGKYAPPAPVAPEPPKPPVVSGWVQQRAVPWGAPRGTIARYLVTCAQNNTHVHAAFLRNLEAYAVWLGARIMVSRFTYDKASYGQKSTKPDKAPTKEDMDRLWYDPAISGYVCDERVRLAPDLLWLGEMNILPTAARPLSGLHTYSGRDSAIVPHVKLAMDSVPQIKGIPAKLLYTTGTCTLRNYIQKKEGLKAEFHHVFGALVVEVDEDGDWFVRQLNANDDGDFQDLDVFAGNGMVVPNCAVETIVWGDIHVDQLDMEVAEASWGAGGILDTLRPRAQFLHDTIDLRTRNRHDVGDPHKAFEKFSRGRESVHDEVQRSGEFIQNQALRDWCETVVVDSNHDDWLELWLRTGDYRLDPVNAMFFLRLQLAKYEAIAAGDSRFHLYEHAVTEASGLPIGAVRFLRTDESYAIAGIEHGMHGHLGPNGRHGSPGDLSRIGAKSNIGHHHSARIIDGLYVAGVSGLLDMGYNKGPSSWSHSHIVTYRSGKRAILTLRGPKWRVPL